MPDILADVSVCVPQIRVLSLTRHRRKTCRHLADQVSGRLPSGRWRRPTGGLGSCGTHSTAPAETPRGGRLVAGKSGLQPAICNLQPAAPAPEGNEQTKSDNTRWGATLRAPPPSALPLPLPRPLHQRVAGQQLPAGDKPTVEASVMARRLTESS